MSTSERLVIPNNVRTSRLYRQLEHKMHRRKTRRRIIRYGAVAANLVVLGVVLAVVVNSHSSTLAARLSTPTSTAVVNPLDQVSSADIALTVASMTHLPEATAVSNQVQSQVAETQIAQSSNNIIAKPQVIATSLKSSADIKDYTAQTGDTIDSIAAKFGISSSSLKWSNGLSSLNLNPGTVLRIPPVNGIVYTVSNGDTAQSLATRFGASADQIIAYNDLETKSLSSGMVILIPGASQPNAATTHASAPAAAGPFAWGIAPVYGYNGYDYGYCTWYVATQLPVPANWGNANTWAYYAAQSGWLVSKTPVAGAIAQTSAGWEGHVAVVNAVSADGTMIQYRDMNGLAGWGRVGYSAWMPASTFQNFIYR